MNKPTKIPVPEGEESAVTERQQAEDLRLLTEAFRDGEIEALEFEMRKAKIFGRGNEVEQGMERQTELAKK